MTKRCYNGEMEHAHEAAISMLHRVKRKAREKNLSCNLKKSDLIFPTHCPILGLKLRFRGGDNSPSLDRLDPKKGYDAGNVNIISNLANRIKSNATSEQLMKVALWLEKNGF